MVLLILLLFATGLFAQKPDRPLPAIPRYEVHRAAQKIQVDGHLDDAAWQTAAPITFIFPWSQQTGAKQKTIARLLWDDEFLYVGYDCEDADIVALYQNHDDPTYMDDAVELFINPKPDQRLLYYGLEMNVRAALYDYMYVFPTVLVKRIDFTGVKIVTNTRGTMNMRGDHDIGWSLEVAIPWSNFPELTDGQAPKLGTTWTANLNRWDGVEPHRRLSQWSDSGMKEPNPHNPARFGELIFIK